MPVTSSAQRSQGALQTSADLPVRDSSIASRELAQDEQRAGRLAGTLATKVATMSQWSARAQRSFLH